MITLSWSLFSTTFALIFLSELPDKTIFAVLLLAAQHRGLPVFAGAALAFLVQTLVALLFGSVLTLIPAPIIHYGSAAMFLFFAVRLWRQTDAPDSAQAAGTAARLGFWACLWLAFVTIFVAEWGDLSQLATAALVAKYQDPWTVGIAATLALWTATALGAVLGHVARGALHPRRIQRLGAIGMALTAVYLLVKG